MRSLQDLRQKLSQQYNLAEADVIQQLAENCQLSPESRRNIEISAADLVTGIRSDAQPGLMEQFLAEYGLSTKEGVALMCLAEAYLRTPDALSLDALIRDKIGSGDWGSHAGSAGSFLVNASTWALMLTGRLFKEPKPGEQPLSDVMLQAVSRLGEPLTQKAIAQAMKILGKQFVLGRNIQEALATSRKSGNKNYRYSFDMLGEAARTEHDAEKYFHAYANAINEITRDATDAPLHERAGISVKLSALHPRYEQVQRQRVMRELVPRLLTLAKQACAANIGFTVDAEEADRLELSLDVIEAVLSNPDLAGWEGFGVVVQAYTKQASVVIQCLEQMARSLGRRITVRLVKGAYWDYEIKNSQVLGLHNYPVFTRKLLTDVSYLSCARQLLNASDTIYPQFATHNAHSACAIIEMAEPHQQFEFQRLHGMGEALHRLLKEKYNRPCRIYAPVGVHKDLLAYLVRRLLENGANSSFVHKLLDENAPVESLVEDPFSALKKLNPIANPRIPLPAGLYGDSRINSSGINLNLPLQQNTLAQQVEPFQQHQWKAQANIPGAEISSQGDPVYSPTHPQLKVGEATETDAKSIELALANATNVYESWTTTPVSQRAEIVDRIADLYQQNQAELIALATLEAGKTRLDGILEIREAIDFCRYYAAQARNTMTDGKTRGIGPIVCISPWNFPLAIFTGQITAALVSGNPVLAKPAEQTTLMAARAIELMYEAGVPEQVLQFVPGNGATVGAALTSSDQVKAVCFTGSIDTATLIDKSLSVHADQDYRLIAETGGLNTMIVDSTALLEQAVRDIVTSAFQSAGQRCSALRILCVQQEIEKPLLEMLEGAARELVIGDPWQVATDVGPVIDEEAKQVIVQHCDKMTEQGRLIFKVPLPDDLPDGHFVSPIAFRLNDLQELKQEIFGPVLHVYSYRAGELDKLVQQINASGFGLTMGIHSRIDTRVKRISSSARIGNIYVNRNQIGAVVGTQPFGGQGLSGTGPKAGGPQYLGAFCSGLVELEQQVNLPEHEIAGIEVADKVLLKKLKTNTDPAISLTLWDQVYFRQKALHPIILSLPKAYADIAAAASSEAQNLKHQEQELPGPTGERNLLSTHARGMVLCLGGGEQHPSALITQVFRALLTGNLVTINSDEDDEVATTLRSAFEQHGLLNRILWVDSKTINAALDTTPCSVVMYDGDAENTRQFRQILAARSGERIALLTSNCDSERLLVEKVVSTDTTASGGNASLLALDDK
jgi:RHH-type transcriptional regulator, proline utilization regulon repressor / proline dehydrogenase / delta 1-pyrroline-5-carboxylate dehydrogenase